MSKSKMPKPRYWIGRTDKNGVSVYTGLGQLSEVQRAGKAKKFLMFAFDTEDDYDDALDSLCEAGERVNI